jgi:spermidine synthase
VLVGLGVTSVSAQVLLLRELIVGASGDETAVGLGLAGWLLGIAGGAVAARRWARRSGGRGAAWPLAGLAAWLALAVPLARFLTSALAPPAGEVAGLGTQLVLAALLAVPPGALAGGAFTALAGRLERAARSRAVAALYVLEALGSLAGGLLLTLLLLPWMLPTRAGLLLGALGAGCALPLTGPGWRRGRPALAGLAVLLAAVSVSPLAHRLADAGSAARFSVQAPGQQLLAWEETPYEHVALGRIDGTVSVYRSGSYAGGFPDPAEHETAAHLLASLSPELRRVLLIGDQHLGQLAFLLRHDVDKVELVQMDREAFALIREQLPRADRRALRDPRVEVVFADPRHHLAREGPAYDLIVLDRPRPETLLLARLTTVEAFGSAARRLTDRGVLVVSLATPPNALTGSAAAMAASVHGAMAAVFSEVEAAPGSRGVLIGGDDPGAVTLDPDVLADRWRRRGVSSEVFVPELFDVLYPPARVAGFTAELRRLSGHVPPSRDARPAAFLHALALRQQTASGTAGGWLARLARVPSWWWLLAMSAPSLLVFVVAGAIRARRPERPAGALPGVHALAATGAAGMLWSLLLLFSFQTRAGALYGQLGALTGLFMAGLGAGGWAGISVTRRWGVRVMPAVALAFAVLVPLALQGIDAWTAMPRAAAFVVHGLLMAAAGAATGGVVPAATAVLERAGRDPVAMGAALEGADHGGAAVGALAGAVILVPVLGLPLAAGALALVQALSAATIAIGSD